MGIWWCALRQSEERLRLALDSARMGIWLWSVDSNIRIWDENLGRLFGLLPDERASRYEDCIQRVHPDDRAMVDGSARRVGVEGGDLDNEFRVLLAGGRLRWIANQGRCLRHP
jgi:two-component system CheB/CheR fusion protein